MDMGFLSRFLKILRMKIHIDFSFEIPLKQLGSQIF